MRPYKNISRNAGVKAYEIGEHSITIMFADGRVYVYDHTAPGREQVEQMKRLAERGRGLTTYINQHVRDNYAHKL